MRIMLNYDLFWKKFRVLDDDDVTFSNLKIIFNYSINLALLMNKTIILGVCMFAILGLALGPVLETASAHVVGKVRGHFTSGDGHDGGDFKVRHDGCVLGQDKKGILHYVDIDGDKAHDKPKFGQGGEPTICLPPQKTGGGPPKL